MARIGYDPNDHTTASLSVENLFNTNDCAKVHAPGSGNNHGDMRGVTFNLNARF